MKGLVTMISLFPTYSSKTTRKSESPPSSVKVTTLASNSGEGEKNGMFVSKKSRKRYEES